MTFNIGSRNYVIRSIGLKTSKNSSHIPKPKIERVILFNLLTRGYENPNHRKNIFFSPNS